MGCGKRPGKGELMSEMPHTKEEARPGHAVGPAGDPPDGDPQVEPTPHKRKRRHSRVILTLGSLLGVVILVVAGIFVYVNFVESSIPRVHVNHLVALPGLLGATFLINTAVQAPAGVTPAEAAEFGASNLIMLLHTNADGNGGGSVSIPGSVRLPVPGHGHGAALGGVRAGRPQPAGADAHAGHRNLHQPLRTGRLRPHKR